MKLLMPALFALAAFGCKDSGPKIVQPEPPMQENKLYKDLPAPEGFKYIQNYVTENPTKDFRILTHILEGSNRRITKAAEFYLKILPTHGWKLEEQKGEAPKPVHLKFTKKDEACTIEIKDKTREIVLITLKVTRKE